MSAGELFFGDAARYRVYHSDEGARLPDQVDADAIFLLAVGDPGAGKTHHCALVSREIWRRWRPRGAVWIVYDPTAEMARNRGTVSPYHHPGAEKLTPSQFLDPRRKQIPEVVHLIKCDAEEAALTAIQFADEEDAEGTTLPVVFSCDEGDLLFEHANYNKKYPRRTRWDPMGWSAGKLLVNFRRHHRVAVVMGVRRFRDIQPAARELVTRTRLFGMGEESRGNLDYLSEIYRDGGRAARMVTALTVGQYLELTGKKQ